VPSITDRKVAFSTPWFELIAKHVDGDAAPHYTVQPRDYASVLATDVDGQILLVKQYRPVVEDFTLELPSGLVDVGETPEASMRRELLEETNHETGAIDLVGTLLPDVGRLGNRMWCFVADAVRPAATARVLDDGIELVRMAPEEFITALSNGRCNHALNLAVVLLATLKGRFGPLQVR
jgi:ADP-ribose pyrophosphatase